MKKGQLLSFELLIQAICVIFFFTFFTPDLVFNNGPATGGDTGSHFWPFHLVKNLAWGEGFFDIRFWNPGNYYGEPLLIHYFPLPFFMGVIFSSIMSLENAFNLITMLGPLTLPLSIYISCKILKFKHPYPSILSILSLIFLFDESWSIYGGNIASTLAGQFAHSISLNFFIIGSALTIKEMEDKKFPLWGCLIFAFCGLSHALSFLAIPIFYLGYLLQRFNFKNIKTLTLAGLFTLSLISWHIIPMIDNQTYNTYYAFVSTWHYIGAILKSNYLIFSSVLLSLPFIGFLFTFKKNTKYHLFFKCYLLLIVFYIIMYFVFPKIGLVDGRSVPHVYLYLIICFGISLSYFLSKIKSQLYLNLTIIVILSCILVNIKFNTKVIHHWIKWNYKSWYQKELSEDFLKLTKYLKGNFSMPRVAYENNNITNKVGSIRAFEMLPYFSNRATTEGVYHQSTLVNNASFYLQSMISKTPSCPFHERFSCSRKTSTQNLLSKMDLLGVNQIIAITDEVKNKLKEYKEVSFKEKFGPWSVYETNKKIKLSQILDQKLITYNKSWWNRFYTWFKDYQIGNDFYVHVKNSQEESFIKEREKSKRNLTHCKSEIETVYNGFNLKTNCPNEPHLVKFAYHSSWRNNNLSPYFMISPGFILTYPKTSETSFQYAKSPLWKFVDIFSIISFLVLIILLLLRYKRNENN